MAVANQQGFGAKNDLRTMGKASTAKRAPGAVLSAEMVLESILLQSERPVAVGSIRLGILKERRDKLADCAPVSPCRVGGFAGRRDSRLYQVS